MSNSLLYITAVLAWGSTWLAINYQLGVVPPEISLVYRYALAAVLLFIWCLWRGDRMKYGWRQHLHFALLGLLLFGLNYIATYSAQQYITSALNAVTFSTMMWMNVINSRLFFRTKIEPRVYLGAALGMLGIIILFWPEISVISWSDKTVLGMSLCLGGAFMASLGNMVSQRSQKEGIPVVPANAWGMLYGSVLTLVVAIVRGRDIAFDPAASYVISLLYLSIVGSIVAFGVYLKLLGRIGAHKAGYAVVMFPMVALVLSYFFEDLQIENHIIIGVALILFGNVVVLGGVKRVRQYWRRNRADDAAVALKR